MNASRVYSNGSLSSFKICTFSLNLTMNCPKCNTTNAETANFCQNCGEDLKLIPTRIKDTIAKETKLLVTFVGLHVLRTTTYFYFRYLANEGRENPTDANERFFQIFVSLFSSALVVAEIVVLFFAIYHLKTRKTRLFLLIATLVLAFTYFMQFVSPFFYSK